IIVETITETDHKGNNDFSWMFIGKSESTIIPCKLIITIISTKYAQNRNQNPANCISPSFNSFVPSTSSFMIDSYVVISIFLSININTLLVVYLIDELNA